MHRPDLTVDTRHHFLDGASLRDVNLNGEGCAAFSLDFVDRIDGAVAVEIGDDDFHSSAHASSRRKADAAGASGDEEGLQVMTP